MNQKTEPPKPCDVQDCFEDATVEVDGHLRLNPGEEPAKWIAVEFRLCPEHEAMHDEHHGEPVSVEPEESDRAP